MSPIKINLLYMDNKASQTFFLTSCVEKLKFSLQKFTRLFPLYNKNKYFKKSSINFTMMFHVLKNIKYINCIRQKIIFTYII